MEKLGESFGRRMEAREKKMESIWTRTFGFMGPFIGSIVGILIIAIVIAFLNLMNTVVMNGFVSLLSNFLSTKIYIFFIASLFFGYCSYLSARHPKGWWLASPIVSSLRVIFVIWILAWIFNLIGIYTGNSAVTSFSSFALVSLPALLSIFIVIGYLIEMVRKMVYWGHKR